MVAAFGTSGLRGPAVDFTAEVCAAYITAFLERCADQTAERTAYVAADLRDSSPRIAGQCLDAVTAAGWMPVWAGTVPTPAVAAYAMARTAPAIMITGSHIPETYNGIKFYRPDGEFLKEDEAPVRTRAEAIMAEDRKASAIEPGTALADIAETYVARYVDAFGASALSGLKIGIDLHSAVGRDLLVRIFEGLGASVHPFRRVERFVAVDTEALDQDDVARARAVIAEHGLDAVISTDGDGDRPLVIDDTGRQINGDVLGVLTAKAIGAKTVVTPLSSTSAVEQSGWFDTVERTRIGSPYVVAAMAVAQGHPVVGFEANGGFLLQDDITLANGMLSRLPTRDAVLPAVACLVLAREKGTALSALAATLPPRFMKADRVKDAEAGKARAFLQQIETSADFRSGFDVRIASPDEISTLDGVRMAFANGDTVHFRQSGNAPEMRIYVETGDAVVSETLLGELIEKLKSNFEGAGMDIHIRDAEADDLEAWLPLWQGYLTFYKVTIAPDITVATWARILDPMNALTCRVASVGGALAGFAHHHTHLTTWDTRPVAYLEDLFVSPAGRGTGIGRALIDDLSALGKEKNWASIYWITADDNETAQKLYDSYNKRDQFIRYSITL